MALAPIGAMAPLEMNEGTHYSQGGTQGLSVRPRCIGTAWSLPSGSLLILWAINTFILFLVCVSILIHLLEVGKQQKQSQKTSSCTFPAQHRSRLSHSTQPSHQNLQHNMQTEEHNNGQRSPPSVPRTGPYLQRTIKVVLGCQTINGINPRSAIRQQHLLEVLQKFYKCERVLSSNYNV
jgi:hypothetical protein